MTGEILKIEEFKASLLERLGNILILLVLGPFNRQGINMKSGSFLTGSAIAVHDIEIYDGVKFPYTPILYRLLNNYQKSTEIRKISFYFKVSGENITYNCSSTFLPQGKKPKMDMPFLK